MHNNVDVLVVGAGLAGLCAARDLTTAGYRVLLLEKSRGVGGRAATKRLELGRHGAGTTPLEGIVRADHGAQFFTARSERFKGLVADLNARGITREWTRGFPRWHAGTLEEREPGNPRYACPEGMNALGKAIRDGSELEPALEVERGSPVSAIWKSGRGWTAVLENGERRHAAALIVNLPAPQALALLQDNLEERARTALEGVKFDPCWAVIAALEVRPEPGWFGLEIDHPVLAWAALDHTKREADAAPVLVLHATGAWSAIHLEERPEQILPAMLEAAEAVLGAWTGARVAAIAHRWRYALPRVTHPERVVAQDTLAMCGDWCSPHGETGRGSPRIEAALESGWATAAYLQERLSSPDTRT
jgi:renalase